MSDVKTRIDDVDLLVFIGTAMWALTGEWGFQVEWLLFAALFLAIPNARNRHRPPRLSKNWSEAPGG